MTNLEVLTPDQRAQVHERTLHVLSTVGMRVDSDEGRALLAESGALVDQSTRFVRFPPALVSALAWPDILVGPGTLAEATVFSFEQTTVDVDIWRLCRKAHAGIVVDEDRWLDNVIERVGPGGHFLGERSTRADARRGEWHFPKPGRDDSGGLGGRRPARCAGRGP